MRNQLLSYYYFNFCNFCLPFQQQQLFFLKKKNHLLCTIYCILDIFLLWNFSLGKQICYGSEKIMTLSQPKMHNSSQRNRHTHTHIQRERKREISNPEGSKCWEHRLDTFVRWNFFFFDLFFTNLSLLVAGDELCILGWLKVIIFSLP